MTRSFQHFVDFGVALYHPFTGEMSVCSHPTNTTLSGIGVRALFDGVRRRHQIAIT